MILISFTFHSYEWAHMNTVIKELSYFPGTTVWATAGIVSYYVFPLCLLEFSELSLDEIVYHYLLFK
jgi:hypothetical protein